MLCSLATKAGAMAGRRGALSGSGKVACVDAPWGGGLGGGGGEGRSVHATAYCPRHVDPLSSASLPCVSFNLCCVDKGPRQGVSRTSTIIHANREKTRAAGGVPLDNPHGDGHGQWRGVRKAVKGRLQCHWRCGSGCCVYRRGRPSSRPEHGRDGNCAHRG